MLWLYRILFLPALVFALPHYLIRMKRRGGYRRNFKDRFGFIDPLPPKTPGKKRVWIQAVSVGEVFAVSQVVRRLVREEDCEIYLSTTTSTGFSLAREKLGDYTVGIGYFPLDFMLFNWLAWRRIQPDVCVLFEGEIWPEHVMRASRNGVPLLLINGRFSDRSFGRFRKAAPAVAIILENFSKILAASEEDRARFLKLGASEERVEVGGNIKLDVQIERLLGRDEKERLARELGLFSIGPEERPLLLLGSSTWPGEEESLLNLLQAARGNGLPCDLLLVPRHAERREEIRNVLEKFSFSFHFRSEGAATETVDVAVGDTTGELILFTQLADVVYVGKSLPPTFRDDGGQTPIEAAALGKPLVYGPYMTNFRSIARELVDCGAALVVGDEVDLIEQAIPVLKDGDRRERMGEKARRWHSTNRGAADNTVAAVRAALSKTNLPPPG